MVETKKQREDREKREKIEIEKSAADRKAAAAKNGPPKLPEAAKTPAADSQQYVTFDQFQVLSNDLQKMQREMQILQIAVSDNSNNSQKFQTEIADLKTEIQNATQMLRSATQAQTTVVNALNAKFDQIIYSLNVLQAPQQAASVTNASASPPQSQGSNTSGASVVTCSQIHTSAAPPVTVSTLTAGGGLAPIAQSGFVAMPTLAANRVVLVADPYASVQPYNSVRTNGNFADWYKEEFGPAAKLTGMNESDVLCRLRNSLGQVCKSQYDLILRDYPDNLTYMVSALSSEFQQREKLGMDTLYERKMQADETVQQYAIELQKLFFKIKPEDQLEAEKSIAPIFRKGIPQSLLKYCRVYPYPDKLSEIVKLVKHYEPEWREERGFGGSVGVSALAAPQILQRSTSNDALYNSNRNYGRKDHQSTRFRGDRRRYNSDPTNQRRGSFTGNCYSCGEPGHVLRNCPNSGRDNGFRGSIRGYNYRSRPFNNSYSNRENRAFGSIGGFAQNANLGHQSRSRGRRDSNRNNSRRQPNSPSSRRTECQLCGQRGHIAKSCHDYIDLMAKFTSAVANLRIQTIPSSPFSIPPPISPTTAHTSAQCSN